MGGGLEARRLKAGQHRREISRGRLPRGQEEETNVPKTAIYSPKVGRPSSPIAHAVRTGNLVFVSGLAPFDIDLTVPKGDFAAQMRLCMDNLVQVLAEAGTSLQHVVKVNVILDRRSDFEEMNRIYAGYFGGEPAGWPARTTIEARLPRPDFLLEIECVAEMPGA